MFPPFLRSKWVMRAGITLVIYTVVGFFVLPSILKWQLHKQLPSILKRNATVEQVRLNPYSLSVAVEGLSLTESDGSPFASFDELYVNLELISLFKRGIVLREIRLVNPSATLVFRADGTFNFTNLIPPASKEPSEGKLPLVEVGHLEISGGGVSFSDLHNEPPFQRRFGPIDLSLDNFTTHPREGSPYSIVARTREGEMFSWAGDFSLQPLHSEGELKVAGLQLKRYEPYVQASARLTLASGTVNGSAHYRLDAEKGPLALEISKGSLDLNNLDVRTAGTEETLLRVPTLSVNGVEASLAQQSIRVASVTSRGIHAAARRGEDGDLNLAALLKTPSKPAPPSSPTKWNVRVDSIDLRENSALFEDRKGTSPIQLDLQNLSVGISGIDFRQLPASLRIQSVAFSNLAFAATILPGTRRVVEPADEPNEKRETAPSPFDINVGAVTLENGTIKFLDRSVLPTVTWNLKNLIVTVRNLSSSPKTASPLSLSGKVNGYAPFSLTGQINPLATDLFVDLKAHLGGTDLTPASPYSAKYAGYALGKGKLSFDLKYDVKRKELKAANKIVIDQFEFGPSSDSPDATKLPVKLAIALFKDRNGVISLDVPVEGRTDDPKFRIGKVVLQVIGDLIVKAVTSPFALIESLCGGGEELSFIAFEPGTSQFAPKEEAKISALEKALFERPALKLNVTGSVEPVKDREAIARKKAEAQGMIKPGATPTERQARKIAAIEVTDADLRALMQERATKVVTGITAPGQISSDRLFVLDPKPIDPATPGQSRAELGLE